MRKKQITDETFIPAPDGWFNYYEDPDKKGSYYREPCIGFIFDEDQWKAVSVDGGYLMPAVGASNYMRTGRPEGHWTPVHETEARGNIG